MDTVLSHTTQAVFAQMQKQLSYIPKEAYTRPLDTLSGSSVGMHFRHILEFYICLEEQFSEGVVCYDLRRRDTTLEQEPKAVQDFLHTLGKRIEGLLEDTGKASEKLQLRILGDHPEEEQFIATSLERELFYTLEHAIHHLALVRAALIHNFPDLHIEPDLGVAPATQRFRRAQG